MKKGRLFANNMICRSKGLSKMETMINGISRIDVSILSLKLLGLFMMAFIAVPNTSYAYTEPENPETMDKSEICEAVLNVESWLAGQAIEGNRLSTYFNVSNAEFAEYIESKSIQTIRIEYFWRNNEGSIIEPVDTIILDELGPEFEAANWSHFLENVDMENGIYLASIFIDGVDCGQQIVIPIEVDDYIPPLEPRPDGLPELTCGGAYEYEEITNETSINAINPDELITIGGFPILVSTITGGPGNYGGTGKVALPFGQGYTDVCFSGLKVNTDREIYSGTVTAVTSDLANCADLTLDTGPLNIGGDICIPPPPAPGYDSDGYDDNGVDMWGFDSLGIHQGTMTEYDENGFNQDGEHISGGSYNDCGCDRNGNSDDVPSQPCNPNCGPNAEASEFAESIRGNLPAQIDQIFTDLTAVFQDSISALNCQQYRGQIDDLIDVLEYDENLIKGEGGAFVNQGMHLNFAKKPRSTYLSAGRDPNATLLENRHIDLYNCDRKEYAVILLKEILTNNSINRPDFVEEVISLIRSWTDYQYSIYADDPIAFAGWLRGVLLSKVQTESGLDASYLVSNDNKDDVINKAKSSLDGIFNMNKARHFYSVASIDDHPISKDRLTDAELAESAFLFKQGYENIHGVHRAFYLEALAKKAEVNGTGNGSGAPLTIEREVGNRVYTIYLDLITFTPTGARTNACIVITDPESGKRFVLQASNVAFDPSGFQGETKLNLVTDIEIRLNNAAMLVLKGSDSTYVAWDCNGFQSMGIDAQIEFCRNFITPLDANFEPMHDTVRYRLDFSLQNVTEWLEFTLRVDAAPFAVTQYQDVKWSLDSMLLDFSSTSTPRFVPMEGYSSPFWDEESSVMAPEWKGFYLARLTAKFPDQFSNGEREITARAFDILIDGSGFTGGVSVGVHDTINREALVSIDEGNLDGWAFSVDEFQLRVLKNQFAGAGMAGEINVPIFNDNFGYEASIFPNSHYEFVVSPLDTIRADLFLADVTIYDGSGISIKYVDDKFKATAKLNGKMNIVGDGISSDGFKFTFPSLTFQNLEVSNQAPYLKSGNWGMEDSLSLSISGFMLRLDNLHTYDVPDDNELEPLRALGLRLAIKLSANIEVTAEGSMGIVGRMVYDDNDRQRWDFERIDLKSLAVGGSIPGVGSMSGGLEWFRPGDGQNDEYGEGFRGYLDVNFDKLGGVGLEAIAQFGKMENAAGEEYKYFYVDALAKFGTLAPTFGVITLQGFGGGVSNNMQVGQSNVQVIDTTIGDTTGIDLILPPIGNSLSNTHYTPDESIGLSLKAAIMISTVKEQIFNGTISMTAVFNDGGGFNKLILEGAGQFLNGIDFDILPETPIPIPGDTTFSKPTTVSAALSAFVFMELNFEQGTFDGNFKVYLNAGTILTGAGHDGALVNSEVHFGPDGWYFHMGTPDNPCGIVLNIADVLAVRATAYFAAGTINVPSIGDVDPRASAIASTYKQNQSLRIPGAGLVFGAAIGVDITLGAQGIAAVNVEAALGFDVMLRKYEGLTCAGETEPVGINGWYSIGQMWAFAQANIEIFGINLAEIGIAAILEARMPNPFYAEGHVGIKFKLGPFKKSKTLRMAFGDDCILQNSEPPVDDPVGFEAISYLLPIDGSANVNTNTKLSVHMAVDFREGVEAGGHLYTADITNIELVDKYGFSVDIDYLITHDGYAQKKIEVTTKDLLPGNDSLTFIVTTDVFDNGNLLDTQTKQISFTTGPDIDFIPESNIYTMWPINGMANYYKDMTQSFSSGSNEVGGYFELRSAQASLLADLSDNEYLSARLSNAQGVISEDVATYNLYERKLSYPIDAANLENEAFYKIELIKYTSPSSRSIPDPIYGPSSSHNEQQSVGIAEQTILYTIYFRTSEFNTLAEKMDAIFENYEGGLGAIETSDILSTEFFDLLEVEGRGQFPPLFTFTSEYTENLTIDTDFRVPAEYENNDLLQDAISNSLGDLWNTLSEHRGYLRNSAVEINSVPYPDVTVDEVQFTEQSITSIMNEQICDNTYYGVLESLQDSMAIIIRNEMEVLRYSADSMYYVDMSLTIDEIKDVLKLMYPEFDLSSLSGGGPATRFARDETPRVIIEYGTERSKFYRVEVNFNIE